MQATDCFRRCCKTQLTDLHVCDCAGVGANDAAPPATPTPAAHALAPAPASPTPPTTTRAGAAAGGPATAPTTAGATAAPHNPASVAPRGGGGTVLLIDGHSLAHRSYWALNARGGDR